MADEGDMSAHWLVRKIEVSEIVRALEALLEADEGKIRDIADALVDIEMGRTEREEVKKTIDDKMLDAGDRLKSVAHKAHKILELVNLLEGR